MCLLEPGAPAVAASSASIPAYRKRWGADARALEKAGEACPLPWAPPPPPNPGSLVLAARRQPHHPQQEEAVRQARFLLEVPALQQVCSTARAHKGKGVWACQLAGSQFRR